MNDSHIPEHDALLLSDSAFRLLHYMRDFCRQANQSMMRTELLICLNRTGRWTKRLMLAMVEELTSYGFVVEEDGFYVLSDGIVDTAHETVTSTSGSDSERRREQARVRKQRQRDSHANVTHDKRDMSRMTSVTRNVTSERDKRDTERDIARNSENLNSLNSLNINYNSHLKDELKREGESEREREKSVTSSVTSSVTCHKNTSVSKQKNIKKSSSLDEILRKLIVSEFAKREQERKPDAVVLLPKAPHRVAQCARWCIDMGVKHSVDSRAVLDRVLDNYFKSPSYWNTSPFHGFLNSYMNMWNTSSGSSAPQKVQRPALPTQDDFKRLAEAQG